MQTDRQTDGQRRCVKAPLLANVTAAGQTDGRTDGQPPHDGIAALMHSTAKQYN